MKSLQSILIIIFIVAGILGAGFMAHRIDEIIFKSGHFYSITLWIAFVTGVYLVWLYGGE